MKRSSSPGSHGDGQYTRDLELLLLFSVWKSADASKSSVESQKGPITIQTCSTENQKDVIAIDIVCPSGSQQDMFEYW